MTINLHEECLKQLEQIKSHLENSLLYVDAYGCWICDFLWANPSNIAEILKWNIGLQQLLEWGVSNVLSLEQEAQKYVYHAENLSKCAGQMLSRWYNQDAHEQHFSSVHAMKMCGVS